MSNAETNREIVREAFDRWAAGTGTFLDLLSEDVEWTIVGSGPSAQTFRSKQEFIDEAYDPIARQFRTPMKPVVVGLYADGSEVIVHWDGAAELNDGQIYRNRYAWFFEFRDEKVAKATAFLDLPTYDAALAGGRLPEWRTPTVEAGGRS